MDSNPLTLENKTFGRVCRAIPNQKGPFGSIYLNKDVKLTKHFQTSNLKSWNRH